MHGGKYIPTIKPAPENFSKPFRSTSATTELVPLAKCLTRAIRILPAVASLKPGAWLKYCEAGSRPRRKRRSSRALVEGPRRSYLKAFATGYLDFDWDDRLIVSSLDSRLL